MNRLKIGSALCAIAMSLTIDASAGNGAPRLGCFNLQIIGVKSKSADLTSSNRHSLFVPINGRTKILLQEGAFQVIDGNGTDGIAKFSLPNPDPLNTGTSAYSVYARLVGKPGSGIDITTCGIDDLGDTYCSLEKMSMSRIAGSSKFQNVSQELLYVYADINADGTIDRIPLFSSSLQDYYWDVETLERVHAQLRFCPVPTTVK